MSEETAREQADREVGRTNDKRKTPERRSYRAGSGRRRNDSEKERPEAPGNVANPIPQHPPSPSPDQRRFNRL